MRTAFILIVRVRSDSVLGMKVLVAVLMIAMSWSGSVGAVPNPSKNLIQPQQFYSSDDNDSHLSQQLDDEESSKKAAPKEVSYSSEELQIEKSIQSYLKKNHIEEIEESISLSLHP